MSKWIVLLLLCVASPFIANAKPNGERNQCGSPRYKVSLTYSETNDTAALAISIAPRDVTVKNLLALACQLRADYSKRAVLLADIFNDDEAAKHTAIHGVENPKGSN